jgi:hypothetical protein
MRVLNFFANFGSLPSVKGLSSCRTPGDPTTARRPPQTEECRDAEANVLILGIAQQDLPRPPVRAGRTLR